MVKATITNRASHKAQHNATLELSAFWKTFFLISAYKPMRSGSAIAVAHATPHRALSLSPYQ